MDCTKTGILIKNLRKKKNMTQMQLANAMHVSDKAVSKWERGIGCPDISLLNQLSTVLNIDIDTLLLGDLETNDVNGGNMKKTIFYMCPVCSNLITANNTPNLSCCGHKLEPLIVNKANDLHEINVQELENDYYISFNHDMTKEHFISFVAHVMTKGILILKLYPEQSAEVRFPKIVKGQLYFYCNKHGLMTYKL